MDGVNAIANILRMEGVDFIACVPYQPLLEAAAIVDIRPLIFRQEGPASTWWTAIPGSPMGSGSGCS